MLMCVCCMENVMRLAEKKKLARAHNEQQLDWLLNSRCTAKITYRPKDGLCILFVAH